MINTNGVEVGQYEGVREEDGIVKESLRCHQRKPNCRALAIRREQCLCYFSKWRKKPRPQADVRVSFSVAKNMSTSAKFFVDFCKPTASASVSRP